MCIRKESSKINNIRFSSKQLKRDGQIKSKVKEINNKNKSRN